MCHVLIIEDEPLVAMDLEALLEREGATSFAFAASQADAVREAFSRRPDFITSDVSLTEGTGPLAVEAIIKGLGRVPVIFITGTPDACRPCDAGPVLSKPFNRTAIAKAFHDLVPAVANSSARYRGRSDPEDLCSI
ncbi:MULTISPECIES: response regulator [unclassified Sphingomonas]|uniref:response regulator n=1 Tax=unclassified Sphingomonas TaxID=196159 RepID=UPI00226A3685|nr:MULTISPECIES: response regulator [unclassified Sphingomonas]